MTERIRNNDVPEKPQRKRKISRKDFFKLTGAGVVLALVGTGCGVQMVESTTDEEKLMAHAIDIYLSLASDPKHAYWQTDLAIATAGILQNQGRSEEVLELFNGLKEPFMDKKNSKLIMYDKEARLLASTPFIAKSGLRDKDTLIQIHTAFKEALTTYGEFATMLAIMAVAEDGNVDKVLEAYNTVAVNITGRTKGFFGGDSENIATRATLTSALLKTDNTDVIKRYYETLKKARKFDRPAESAANLTLAVVIEGSDTDKILKLYDSFAKIESSNASRESESVRTALTVAAAISGDDAGKTINMYRYAQKVGLDSRVSSILTLATVANLKEFPLLTTVTSESCGDDCTRYMLVPILLSKYEASAHYISHPRGVKAPEPKL